jgi:hypothetical protein
METINSLDWMKEEFTVSSIKFYFHDKTAELDMDFLIENSFWTRQTIGDEIFCFSIVNRNGIEAFISKLEYCIHKPFEVIATLKSTMGSVKTVQAYVGRMAYDSYINQTDFKLYGSLNSQEDYRSYEDNYLIEESSPMI